MARINVEDQFWLDVMSVIEAIGDQDKAIGNALRFLRFAQEKHKSGRLISEEDFARAKFSEALIGVFAARVEGGIMAIGAQKHFGWLVDKTEAGHRGGVESAKRPRDAKGRLTKAKQTQAESKQNPSETKLHQPSSSSSSSYSRSTSNSLEEKKDENPSDSKPQAFIAAYCERFKLRWGTNPPIQGKEAGIAGRLAKGMGLAKFETLLDAYFQMPDAQVVKWKHPLAALEMKLNEVTVFADSGKFTTHREAHNADNMATNALLAQKVQRGEA